MNFGLDQPKISETEYSPSTLIIFVDSNIGKDDLKKAIEEYQAEVIYDYNSFNSMAIKIPSGKTIEEAIQYFQNVKGVIMVNRDQKSQLF
ncbi:hypothetical protein H8356DRAFT_1751391 [Neocallimastix lanati (nom. inval.)]|uniref:Fervidolysin-like N-terminal prodomain domain-containing protein n=1 Tax=Neocallimastix californiae TaxID=1754190 RepID=A0A1Y2FHK6_9FUNG|nr:hypothetical protein H8356DRAFT_1751391 [Neocallimastix sp. JGI-2020a]ORY82736.1 hypothetical protein LY90DRAFT_697397 [Neocallimastix californiae]|eukprot:ORY82736.1 hypothetical protein LY90DRAFT_697397 [Neocallimastix californiae]